MKLCSSNNQTLYALLEIRAHVELNACRFWPPVELPEAGLALI
jgi:hypothetical protein